MAAAVARGAVRRHDRHDRSGRDSGDKADARSLYASQVQSMKNNLKRAQGELDGLRRSDAVRVRDADEAAMLAWLDKQPDGAAARRRHRRRAGAADPARWPRASATSCVSSIRGSTQLLSAALTAAAPGARTRQARCAARVRLPAARRSADRGRAEAGAAPLRPGGGEGDRSRTCCAQYRALPAAQHVPEFDAVFGTTRRRCEAQARRAVRRHEARRRSRSPGDAAAMRTSLPASTTRCSTPRRRCCRRCCAWRKRASSATASCCACVRRTCAR